MRRAARATLFCLFAALAATPAHACPAGETSGVLVSHRILAASGGALLLEDGRRWAPAGALLPSALDPAPARLGASKEAAQAFVGQTVVLDGAAQDRYGRLVGPGVLEGTDLAVRLVAAGAAYADPAGRPACAQALRMAEEAARAREVGLWRGPDAVADAADMPPGRVGLFTLAQGRVRQARIVGKTLYVSFYGARGRALEARAPVDREMKSAPGLAPAQLTGSVVRLRGIVSREPGGSLGPELVFGTAGLEPLPMQGKGARR